MKKTVRKIYRAIARILLFLYQRLPYHGDNASAAGSECWQMLENLYHRENISCVCMEKDDDTADRQVMLSIVVPLYNSVPFLDKLLPSLVNQKTKYCYEIILVDDGSTDSTVSFIRKKWDHDEKIRLFSQPNRGISAARNKGIELAEGCYIGFVDHDDLISENYVEKLVEKALVYHADIVKCGYNIIVKGEIAAVHNPEDNVVRGKDNIELFQYGGYIWGGIYSKQLLSKIHFPEGFWYEDMITRILIFRESECYVNISDVLYTKNQHQKNASRVLWSNASPKCLDQLYLVSILVTDNQKLSLPQSDYFYKCILNECSGIMYSRIRRLGKRYIKAVFFCACSIMNLLNCSDEKILSGEEIIYKKSFDTRDYTLWKLMCRSHLI